MWNLDEIKQRAENIRNEVNELSDEQRKYYYRHENKLLRDPDTYAVLNYFFFIGVHHLYLKKYTLFLIEVSILILSLVLLVNDIELGILGIAYIGIKGLFELFLSQRILLIYNNRQAASLLEETKELIPPSNDKDTEKKIIIEECY